MQAKPLIPIPPALAEVAAGRDHISTREFGKAINKAPQTIRKNFCVDGEAYGIRPTKIGNGLIWPVVGVAALLAGMLERAK